MVLKKVVIAYRTYTWYVLPGICLNRKEKNAHERREKAADKIEKRKKKKKYPDCTSEQLDRRENPYETRKAAPSPLHENQR